MSFLKCLLSGRTKPLAVGALIAAGFLAGPVHAEDTLRALTAFPSSDDTSKAFKTFVDEVNARGKGVLHIDIVGGPEVVPGFQQIDAVGRGVVDMTMSPISYALGTMPEADAWVGSNLSPVETHENGGLALIRKIALEKLKVHVLSRFAPGAPLNLFLVKKPKMNADGSPDFSGLRLRASPLYNSFWESLGAVPVNVPVPDIYTGLERHSFDGIGYPPSAMVGWSWDRFLKYRIEPGFLQTDLGLFISPAKWNSLSDASRKLLNDMTTEMEGKSYQDWLEKTKEVKAKFDAEGMQPIELKGAAREAYLAKAYGSVWDRLAKSGSPYAAELKKLYYKN
ncbi:C4-dicarboxylate ABC transporter substrate-binding protein [Thioclava sp. BHET1]|nr:C4-dicarboxylate ABC transporter substrate-binding protein [Thioclava sp. BHET1]